MASPIRTDASDRDSQAQAGGSSVSGETSYQADDHQPLLVSPTPEVESDPTRLGLLLPILYRSGPALCVGGSLAGRTRDAWVPRHRSTRLTLFADKDHYSAIIGGVL